MYRLVTQSVERWTVNRSTRVRFLRCAGQLPLWLIMKLFLPYHCLGMYIRNYQLLEKVKPFGFNAALSWFREKATNTTTPPHPHHHTTPPHHLIIHHIIWIKHGVSLFEDVIKFEKSSPLFPLFRTMNARDLVPHVTTKPWSNLLRSLLQNSAEIIPQSITFFNTKIKTFTVATSLFLHKGEAVG